LAVRRHLDILRSVRRLAVDAVESVDVPDLDALAEALRRRNVGFDEDVAGAAVEGVAEAEAPVGQGVEPPGVVESTVLDVEARALALGNARPQGDGVFEVASSTRQVAVDNGLDQLGVEEHAQVVGGGAQAASGQVEVGFRLRIEGARGRVDLDRSHSAAGRPELRLEVRDLDLVEIEFDAGLAVGDVEGQSEALAGVEIAEGAVEVAQRGLARELREFEGAQQGDTLDGHLAVPTELDGRDALEDPGGELAHLLARPVHATQAAVELHGAFHMVEGKVNPHLAQRRPDEARGDVVVGAVLLRLEALATQAERFAGGEQDRSEHLDPASAGSRFDVDRG